MKLKLALVGLLSLFGFAGALLFASPQASADSFNPNRIIDDAIFDNSGTMSAAQIDAFLNTFPSSCLSTTNGFTSPDPTGYSYSTGFTFGKNVSAGTVLAHTAQAYDINPQVLLSTLQKEQSLVTGAKGCYPNTPDPTVTDRCDLYGNGDMYNCTDACPFSLGGGCVPIAVGYGCPGRCNADQEGFSNQIIRAAWMLKFSEQRSEGNIGWAIIKDTTVDASGNPWVSHWDNSDDPQSCYGGNMTQGTWQRCPSGASTYYDGYATISNSGGCAGLPATVSVHLDTGATAALYRYTPFICGNYSFFNIFTGWFGSTQVPNYSSQYQSVQNYTDESKTTSIPANTMVSGQRTYMILSFKNTGNVTWKNSGPGTVRLATLNTSNSPFCDGSWITCQRPAGLTEASVAPGEIGTFAFWYEAPSVTKDTSFTTEFGVVSEAVAIMTGTRQVQTTLVQQPVYAAQYLDVQNYTDSTGATSIPANTLRPDQKTYMVLRFKNTGNTVWKSSGNGAVRLATLNTTNSPFCDATWISCQRPAQLQEAAVAPGGTGTFAFWYKASDVSKDTSYVTQFGVLSEAVAIMTGTRQVQTTLVQYPRYYAQYQSVQNYTDDTRTTNVPANVMTPGQRTYMVLSFENTGNVTWKNSGNGAVRLATLNTTNSPFCDATWISCQRPAGLTEATVAPGETGTFAFWYEAPSVSNDTSFQTDFGVISEAVAIMTGTRQVQTTLVQK